MDNLEEMDRFLEKFNLPRLNQEEREITNKPITSTENCDWEKFSLNKCPGPDDFTVKVYQTFREELMTILLKLFQKIEKKGALPNSFYEATITLTSKPEKQKNKIAGHRWT